MNIIGNKVSARYSLRLEDGSGGVKFQSSFSNMLTDLCLDQMSANRFDTDISNYFSKVALGKGTLPSTGEETALIQSSVQSALGTKYASGIVTEPVRYKYHTRQFSFAAGVATGSWNEIGIMNTDYWNGWGRANDLMSRTLIKDENGNPITLVKEATDVLYVLYEFRQYIPTGDFVGTVVEDGVEYTYTVRAHDITHNRWAYQDWICNASYSSGPQVAVAWSDALLVDATSASYNANGGTYYGNQSNIVNFTTTAEKRNYRDSVLTLEPSAGNFPGGISMITIPGWQIAFSPKIPKNDGEALTMDLRFMISRA